MVTRRPNSRAVAALAVAGLCGAVVSCTVASTATAPARPSDPVYDGHRNLAAQYSTAPECQPQIESDLFTATLLAEPALCPTSWENPEPSPCTQIEMADGTRQPVTHGIIGLIAAGNPPRMIRLGRLTYPDLRHCLPTDVTPPGLIYMGPAAPT